MLRRLGNAALLVGAALLITRNVAALGDDLRRGVLVMVLVCLGVFLNFSGLLLPRCGLQPWVRVLGCILLLIVAGGFGAGAWLIDAERIAPEARADPEFTGNLAATVRRFAWLAAAAVYVAVSLLLLPPGERDEGARSG